MIAAEITVELGAVEAMATAINSITRGFEKKSTLNKIVNHIANQGRVQFGMLMDTAAREAPDHYSHLYEWDGIGQKTNRLFKLVSSKATEGNITMKSEFLDSKKEIPERELVGQTIPVRIKHHDGSWSIRRMEVFPRGGQHIFKQKASIMEQGVTVNIAPTKAKSLFWVDPKIRKGYMMQEAKVDYSRRPTANQFTESWDVFWESMVDRLVIVPAVKSIEKEVGSVIESILAKEAAKTQMMGAMGTPGSVMPGTRVRVTVNGKPTRRIRAKRNKVIENRIAAAVTRALRTDVTEVA